MRSDMLSRFRFERGETCSEEDISFGKPPRRHEGTCSAPNCRRCKTLELFEAPLGFSAAISVDEALGAIGESLSNDNARHLLRLAFDHHALSSTSAAVIRRACFPL